MSSQRSMINHRDALRIASALVRPRPWQIVPDVNRFNIASKNPRPRRPERTDRRSITDHPALPNSFTAASDAPGERWQPLLEDGPRFRLSTAVTPSRGIRRDASCEKQCIRKTNSLTRVLQKVKIVGLSFGTIGSLCDSILLMDIFFFFFNVNEELFSVGSNCFDIFIFGYNSCYSFIRICMN